MNLTAAVTGSSDQVWLVPYARAIVPVGLVLSLVIAVPWRKKPTIPRWAVAAVTMLAVVCSLAALTIGGLILAVQSPYPDGAAFGWTKDASAPQWALVYGPWVMAVFPIASRLGVTRGLLPAWLATAAAFACIAGALVYLANAP